MSNPTTVRTLLQETFPNFRFAFVNENEGTKVSAAEFLRRMTGMDTRIFDEKFPK